MTWSERNLVYCGTKVKVAFNLLQDALSDVDPDKYPSAFGLIKAAYHSTMLADKELGCRMYEETARIE